MWERKSVLIFYVNGKRVEEDDVNPEWTLLYYLRNKLYLCGAKLGCAEGGCGACTVMVSKYDRKNNTILHIPVNACLAPVCSMHGLAVTTIEGIGSTKTKLHPVQERIANAHGSQCGFCTPGIVMSMYTLLRNMEKPSMKNLEEVFQGNLCRCTGYRPILEAYKTFTEDYENMRTTNGAVCGLGSKCCKVNSYEIEEELFQASEFTPLDVSQEPIFPPELKEFTKLDEEHLYFPGEYVTWYRPVTLDSILDLKSKHPHAKIVAGNTEIGVEVKFKNQNYPIMIQPTNIEQLNVITVEHDGITVGASVTLDYLKNSLNEQIATLPEIKTKVFKAIVEMLHWFAGKQIRSVASVGGNIMTGSPISDLNPIFMAAEVVLCLRNKTGERFIKMDDKFFTGYRSNVVQPDEVLVSIKIPHTKPNQFFYSYKQARRRDDDIAIVNSAFNIQLKNDAPVILDVKLVFGGMGPTTISAVETSEKLKGLTWNKKILDVVNVGLLTELKLSGNAPGGMVEYRKTLPMSFFFKTFISISSEILDFKIPEQDLSACSEFTYKTPKSSQFFQVTSDEQKSFDAVGRPIVHSSAVKQATGEAIYFDDIPRVQNELYLAFVYTTKSHAVIKSINFTKALETAGVVGYISVDDIPEGKKLGPVHQDEELFISRVATSQNQLLGAIVAEDQFIAKRAVQKVEVEYEELQPVIVSIEDAIKHNSFFDAQRKLVIGDVGKGFEEADHVLEGECRTGYQEHFYLETHGCLAVPKEGDLEIFCSSQHHCEITDFVSRVLEIPQNRIVTRIKRIGGGFGGKQSRGVPIAVATAVAAKKFNRAVRVMLDRNEDMAATGGRHPYYIKYKVGFNKDGRILAYDAEVFANGGFSSDLSIEVLERAVFHIENSYKIPNLRVIGRICKTNLPTNTAFRGFGAPQSMFAAENMMRDVAEFLNEDSVQISLMHLYKEGDITHYNQFVENCNLKRCVEECLQASKYYERKQEIEQYNRNNRWKKRGISMVSTKYGVGFGVPMLEQAGALVMIYTDGSVLITHSGVEMGQGLNTKMIQVASRVLEIPTDNIYISECATDKVPNTSPTAASVGSDLNGMAVMRACNTLKERLKPIIAKKPEGKWKDWILTAFLERVSLSATGYYSTPDIEYNWDTNTGKPYNYYTFGASCTEVEIDCLTGDHQVLRTDIVMDIGTSLNPAIDIGQIEGGFMQGYGLFVMEEMVYSPTGTIYSKGPGTYKIPGFNDIPIELNVSLLKGVSNPRAVYSSKAVGEPPLFLASSALFAIREAIKYARVDAGKPKSFRLNAPATAEKIRMACEDDMTDSVNKTRESCVPWNVIP